MEPYRHEQDEEPIYLLEAAMRHVDEAVVITTKELDPPGPEIVYVNDGFCRMTGYAVEEVIGKTPRILQGPKTERAELDRLRRCLSRGEGFSGRNVVNYRKDGSEYVLDWHIVPLRDDAGEIAYWMASQRDVTERKKAEEELRRSEAGLPTAQRMARLGNWEYDVAKDQMRWSDELYRIYGFAPRQFDPTLDVFLDSVHPDDREAVRRYAAELPPEEEPDGIDHRVVWPDGEVRVVHNRREVERDQAGQSIKITGTVQDVTERRALERQLEHQAFHDSLTGLPNRTLFMERLQHALTRADRREGQVAVLFMDLDNFKVVNDSLGHEAGDRLLVAVAKRLEACLLRPEITLTRFGGDEFAILVEDVASVKEATRVAERVMEGLREPFVVDGREMYVTTSIGVVLAASSQDLPQDLLRNADAAMYRAKEEGRTRYQVFDPGMNARVLERLELENGLRRALERDEFRLCYQPKVLIEDGAIVGFEALVRWEHPERGLLSPAEFIPVAEETDLIVPLGRWVLEEACRQAKEWQELYPGDPPLVMCVNISGKQLRHPSLVQDVASVLNETRLDPGSLDLEVTESVLVEDARATTDALLRLKRLGVKLIVDDFGTGYSSLSYLKRLPVDYLKIDRSFVEGLGKDPEDRGIVSAVIDLAHVLGMDPIAEGVETAEQADQLQELGCRLAQGYRFSRPLPAEAASTLLAGNMAPPGRTLDG